MSNTEGAQTSARITRPLVSPDAFAGYTSWSDWVDHFEAAARVNGWDDATKLNWLPVRLMGKAQTAWKRLIAEAKADNETAKDALERRFEPSSKREHYAAEFHQKKKSSGEQWGDFADQLRNLADKAFPTLSDDAKELLALDRFLGELSDVQSVVVVRQRRSKTLVEAVATVLETESYVAQGKSETKNLVVEAVDKPDEKCEVGTVRVQPDVIPLLESIVKRLVKLQSKRDSFAIRPQQEWKMKVSVDDIALQLMVDTGAAVSLLRKDQWVRLVGPNGEDGTMKCYERSVVNPIQDDGLWCVPIRLCNPSSAQNVAVPLESLVIAKQEKEFCQAVVTLTEKVIVPPWSKSEVLGYTGAMCTTGTWLRMIASTFPVTCDHPCQKQSRSIPVSSNHPCNNHSRKATVYSGMEVAVAERIEEHHLAVVAQESNHPLYSPGEEVPLHKQDILHNLVKECEENISEKEHDELGRSSAVKHSISTDDHLPIKQPCRQIPFARQEHAHKLVKETLAREVIQ
eukprot:Em0007g1351a